MDDPGYFLRSLRKRRRVFIKLLAASAASLPGAPFDSSPSLSEAPHGWKGEAIESNLRRSCS